MNETYVNVAMVILAGGAAVSPVIYGFLIFRLSTYFVSKGEFKAFDKMQDARHTENQDRMATIEDDIKTLLRRE